MFSTLKTKFSLVYICLVAMIAVIGAIAVLSLYNLSGAINNLMIANYKSIDALGRMMDALERMDSAILIYINGNRNNGENIFTENRAKFENWLPVADNNITEPGEKERIETLKKRYAKFTGFFSRVREIRNFENAEKAAIFYENSIMPEFLEVKKEIRAIVELNEKAMFKGKNEATDGAKKSTVIILVSAVTLALGGLAVSGYFVNRLLYPVYSLTDTLKTIREGNMNQRAQIVSNDEIGVLAGEFNNMTGRLSQFERSTLGSVMTEKNKTLAILKSISDPIIVMDRDYKIVLLNSAFEEYFGVTEENAANRHFLEAIKDEDLFEHIALVYVKGQEAEGTGIMAITGRERTDQFKITVTKVEGRDSNLTGLVVSFHNVTDFKNLEKIKSDFIYVISHEFKTPLTSIIMGTSLLMDDNLGTLNERQLRVLDTIREDGERLSNLVINLLELSRLESDKSIYKMNDCSPSDIIETALTPFYPQAEAGNIELIVSVDKNLPRITADFDRLSCVVDNIVSNALKHSEAGGAISITASLENRKIRISVKDTGRGIPSEYKEKIFEKYFQIKTADGETPGTGLGLSITREIVEAHGGRIWCESVPGAGCAFIVELPVPFNDV